MIGEAYRKLEDRFRRIGALRDAESMLHWDLATMMPKGGAPARGDQLAVLGAVRHGLLVASEVGDWLAEAEADPSLDAWRRADVREMKRQRAHATALSESQVEALSRATTACEAAWRGAKADDDFGAVHRTAEFPLYNMISHGLAEIFNPVLQAAQLECRADRSAVLPWRRVRPALLCAWPASIAAIRDRSSPKAARSS